MDNPKPEDKLIEQRKEKIISFLKSDYMFSTFLTIAILSFFFSIYVKSGAAFAFSAKTWFALSIFSSISAAFAYFKKHKYVFYPILAWIVWVAVEIRTLNLPYLRDITTSGWTLGPDLDPFLFLRWAKYIVAHGSLMAIDAMRYVPLGFETKSELILLPHLIAWFHKFAVLFGSTSVEHSAVLFPTFMFALAVIAFFLLVREIFVDKVGINYASIIALIASFFLSVFPVLLPRTISGIPEKESAAFFFLFMAFYFFLCAWKSPKLNYQIPLAILSGLATAGMALVWGGVIFIFLSISLAVLVAFIIGQIDKKRTLCFALWLFFALLIANLFSLRYRLSAIISSTTTLIPISVIFILLIHLVLFETRLKSYFERDYFSKVPKPVVSIIIAILIGAIAGTLIFGIQFIPDKIRDVLSPLITPISDRLGVTVAENRQPFFGEWETNFGPHIQGIALFFWLFFIGSIYLFYFMIDVFVKKERWILTLSYIFLLTAVIFSRYSPNSILNGTNAISIGFYLLGVILFFGVFGYYYYRANLLNRPNNLKEINFGIIFLFSFFFLGIISARGAVRLIMILAIPVSIIVSSFIVLPINDARKSKDSSIKNVLWLIIALILFLTVFSGNYFYKSSAAIAQGYAPSVYNQQWQKAMSWVRENTPESAVFAHWWDYGYWVQSIGERATILDGGNMIPYWNHLMGRLVLTAPNDSDGLEFLFSHNGTHFLIDSTDIGKYAAFSSIGSGIVYDRRSWITTFIKDSRQTQEKKNSTLYVYAGGFLLDSDISYNLNGTMLFFPGGEAGIGAIIIERDKSGNISKNPEAIFVYKHKQFRIPLRYVYDKKLIDFNSGLDFGVFLFPRLTNANRIDFDGAMLLLSNRTVKSALARLYLYKEDNPYFELVHTEDSYLVSEIKKQFPDFNSDFVFYNDFNGPIRIWEIHYPKDIKAKPEYLNTTYPDVRLMLS